jgi:hypothetical protein
MNEYQVIAQNPDDSFRKVFIFRAQSNIVAKNIFQDHYVRKKDHVSDVLILSKITPAGTNKFIVTILEISE